MGDADREIIDLFFFIYQSADLQIIFRWWKNIQKQTFYVLWQTICAVYFNTE